MVGATPDAAGAICRYNYDGRRYRVSAIRAALGLWIVQGFDGDTGRVIRRECSTTIGARVMVDTVLNALKAKRNEALP
jgi:hypothetical protein